MSLITLGYYHRGIVTRGYGVTFFKIVLGAAVKIFYRAAVPVFVKPSKSVVIVKERPKKR